MLNRFYISIVVWLGAVTALGLFARGSQDGIAIVLAGIIPIGVGFILLLLYFVLRNPSSTPNQELPGITTPSARAGATPVIDWAGKAPTWPVEPRIQCDTIRLEPRRPDLRLVHSATTKETP